MLEWDEISGRGDPRQRFRVYRVHTWDSSPELVATCATECALGVLICSLGREGEWDGCSVGVLDTSPENAGERKWVLNPWDNVSREERHVRES